MLYLLDANVLIDANRDYYPLQRVPEFWEWLAHHGSAEYVKIPIEVYDEIRDGNDDLAIWSKHRAVTESLQLNEEAIPVTVASITENGYAPDLTDDEVAQLGRDPFLISYAVTVPGSRTIVTTEVSKPSRQRANRHIPDVCKDFHIPCINTFEFLRILDFSTHWAD